MQSQWQGLGVLGEKMRAKKKGMVWDPRPSAASLIANHWPWKTVFHPTEFFWFQIRSCQDMLRSGMPGIVCKKQMKQLIKTVSKHSDSNFVLDAPSPKTSAPLQLNQPWTQKFTRHQYISFSIAAWLQWTSTISPLFWFSGWHLHQHWGPSSISAETHHLLSTSIEAACPLSLHSQGKDWVPGASRGPAMKGGPLLSKCFPLWLANTLMLCGHHLI